MTDHDFIPHYVNGFLKYVEDRSAEYLYATTPDGRVFRSGPYRLPNDNFDKVGRVWEKVEVLPEDAIWCGRYSYPPSIREA